MTSRILRLKDDFLALLTEEEHRTLRGIAARYALRREMDAEVDGQGRRWDRNGQEVDVQA
jgi:hypothetical protein